MRKNLFTGMAAILFCGVFTSCSHDMNVDTSAFEQSIQQKYEEAFKARFGNPASDQTWGFGASDQARTRGTNGAPAPTYVGPTYNAIMAEAATKTGNAFRSQQVTYGQIEFLKDYQSWDNSGWSDVFYQIDAKPTACIDSDEKLKAISDIILKEIPEGNDNRSKAVSPGYSLITAGGPVTMTPIYHNSSSADKISYYYYKTSEAGDMTPERIKALPKYTVGYMADPNVVKNGGQDQYTFYHDTFSLVYVDENGNASYDFPKNYEIHFIISNVDLAHNYDIAIFDKVENGQVKTKQIKNYPEYYADGRLNAAIHSSGIGQWKLGDGMAETPHAAIFRIGEKNYVGFEDWIDLDFNDVIFEMTGTEGGTTIEGGDEWEELRVIAEDLQVGESTDFDFNDVVFDVYRYTKTTEDHTAGDVWIILQAAGGTLPLYVAGYEVHEQFDVNPDVMVNTNAKAKGLKGEDREPVAIKLNSSQYNGSSINEIANSIEVKVIKDGVPFILQAPEGKIASKIGVGCDFKWCAERQDIDNKYKLVSGEPLFKNFVQGILPALRWYQYAYDSILNFKPAF